MFVYDSVSDVGLRKITLIRATEENKIESYRTFDMLITIEHEVLSAHRYQNRWNQMNMCLNR